MVNQSEDLTPQERREFEALATELDPPIELEDQVVSALQRRGLLDREVRGGPSIGFGARALALAACVACLVVGIGVGRTTVQPGLPRASFILFLHEGPEFEPFSDANFADRFSDYNRWIAGTRGSGHFITGEQLDGTGRVVLPGGATPRVEERVPVAADGDMLGMFFIRAQDYEEAMKVAMTL
ncbi:MAG: hypothetical protein HKN73_07065, partial [Gemmatimonadetes bacterium]|nr:hypothetical protein [Gemmatimonadota bacterium]